ncbi:MAG: aminotransferase class I/II-fold pyridoxal phosphate-dependent enzyme [Alphaproteobacteria bacterium]|jgi:succinyldiaminopimelate transaminase|nr:aminotransferase class I/II-fold pyridoxal phosphate-dependent enzyme [Alphaproteobacteria bacterium]
MHNPRLASLPDYPFERLRGLLDHLPPPDGLSPIALSLGEPQHPYPDFVGDILHANRHLYGKYPPVAGTPEFRQAVADWLNRRYDLPAGLLAADRHIAPCAGTREALFRTAFLAVPPEKDGRQPAVLMPNPFYQCYAGAAIAAGAEPIFVSALPERGFLPDFAGLAEETLARTALVYFCTPANPQGAVADGDYLAQLVRLARQYDFTLVVDECYAEIYTGAPPPGTLQACADLGGEMTNVLVFHSLSKRSNVAGLRSGFLAGDAELIRLFRRLSEYGGNPSPLPVYAAATALWGEESHVEANRALYLEKFEMAERILSNRFGFYRPDGGFFLWLDVGDGEAATRELWTRAAVRVLPGAYLAADEPDGGTPGARYIRVAMVHEAAVTADALGRIAETL